MSEQTDMDVADVLNAAADYIATHGLNKGDFTDCNEYACCVLGTLAERRPRAHRRRSHHRPARSRRSPPVLAMTLRDLLAAGTRRPWRVEGPWPNATIYTDEGDESVHLATMTAITPNGQDTRSNPDAALICAAADEAEAGR